MKKVEEVTGKAPPQLQEYYDLPFPEEMFPFWNDFLELNRKRSRTESGDCPLTFLEIDAWARLVDAKPSQLWMDIIEMLDQTWLIAQNRK